MPARRQNLHPLSFVLTAKWRPKIGRLPTYRHLRRSREARATPREAGITAISKVVLSFFQGDAIAQMLRPIVSYYDGSD